MSHSNISVFVPHIGCPCRCTFCDQNSITQSSAVPNENDVHNAVKTALSSRRYDPKDGQIAFFGGSFTAIDRDYMLSLLSAAKQHIDNGDAGSIRISTRPDFIDDEILSILKSYGVSAIELGAQSMDDEVLKKNRRGHTAECVAKASELIKSNGFELGLQMMTGLYCDTDEKSLATADKLIALKPATVRIYPAVVLKNTELARLMEKGEYRPQSVEEAVNIGAVLIPKFLSNGIKVIRFGLHTAQQSQIVGGAWHPALAQLVYSRIARERVSAELSKKPKGAYDIKCPKAEISTVIGQKRENILYFKEKGYDCRVVGCEYLGGISVQERKK